jgi:hypothetical protein
MNAHQAFIGELTATLEALGLEPEFYYPESAPGQQEISIHDDYIGTSIRHVVMHPPGGGGGGAAGGTLPPLTSQLPAEPIPPGFNWDLFQGPRRVSPSSRRGEGGAGGTPTAAAGSRTGAYTSSTSWRGSWSSITRCRT